MSTTNPDELLQLYFLYILDPQAPHGLGNSLLRALLRLHPYSPADCEDYAHLHVNNLFWGRPKTAPSTAALAGPPSDLASETGLSFISSPQHVYLETEKHTLLLATDLIQPSSPILTATELALLQQDARPQEKQLLLFHLREQPAHTSRQGTFVAPQQLRQELAALITAIKPPLRAAAEQSAKILYALMNYQDRKHQSYRGDLQPRARYLLHQELKPALVAQLKQLRDLSSYAVAPQLTGANTLTELAANKHTELRELRDYQRSLEQPCHCWLWYPLKFRQRYLVPQGLPFVVYELQSPHYGKLTLDLHYTAAAWHLEVFRRPGRAGLAVAAVLEQLQIPIQACEQQPNYVPKYLVLSSPEPTDLQHLKTQIAAIIAALL